jgi:hypothetical protein
MDRCRLSKKLNTDTVRDECLSLWEAARLVPSMITSRSRHGKNYVEPTEGIGLDYCVAPRETMREIP